jgi:DNA-binding CsgD family transcriptional regulator
MSRLSGTTPVQERGATPDLCRFVLVAEGRTEICRTDDCALWRDGCVAARSVGSLTKDKRVAAFVVGLRDMLGSIDGTSASIDEDGVARRWADTLTPAERRVFGLLPTHLSLGAIGDHLCVSRATVKTHVRSIYRKLDVTSRNEAIQRGVHLGVLPTGSPVAVPR